MPILTNRRSATLQGHACYPQINRDGWKTGGRGEQSAVQPISSGAGLNNDNTTRLSPLIKAQQQLGEKCPRQAMALVESCTSVTQNKRGSSDN